MGSIRKTKVDSGVALTCQLFYDYIDSHLKDRQFGATKTRTSDESKRQRSYATSYEPLQNKQKRGQPSAKTGLKMSCFYCNGDHWIARCSSFRELTMEDRWKWAQDTGSCIRCLSTRHQTAACHRTSPCGSDGCGQQHHHLLHRPAADKTKIEFHGVQPVFLGALRHGTHV